jgi:TolA-binding protein
MSAPRSRLARGAAVLAAVLGVCATARAQRGADIEGRFQDPAEERRIEVEDEAGEVDAVSRRRSRGGAPADSLEERLYLRERPDAVGDAARDYQNATLEQLLAEREQLLEQRRRTAIELLETFIREEPESAPEMPDALLRLAELRWEQARADYLEAFAAWQQVPAENRSANPPRPDYTVSIELYDRILEHHRDYPRYDLVLYMKAFAMTELGRPDVALDLYRRILDEFPESRFVPDSHMALAEARFAEADFTGALERYDQVLRYRESELYGMALFKSAWCLWRMNRTTEAATRFRRVLDLGRGRGNVSADQRARLRELQSEALEYLIQVFTEDESNTAQDLFAFLEEIGGERYADRVLVRLAARFYDQDRWQHGIEAYELILERLPADERAPRWALQVARGRAALGEPDAAVDALERLAEGYLEGGDWARQQSDPELIRETREMIERALRVRGMRWHDLAQREEQTALFERAERIYDIYLTHFPESEASYDLRFYRAEILFHRLERWDAAGRTYLAAAQQDPQGQYTRDALYNAIGAFERVREAQLERCTAQGGAAADGAASGEPAAQGGDGEASEAAAAAEEADDDGDREDGEDGDGEDGGDGEGREDAERAAQDPCGETDNDRRFSEAIELYVELFPEDPDLPEILFRQGRLYYDREIFDPAVRLFGQLLERYPNSPYAVTAGELILESFNRARDYQNIERWARRLKDSPAFQTEESQRRLDTLILQAVFATGEQLAERGEHDDAAQAYLRAAREFPRDERAPQAYFNAGIEFQAAGDLSGAASAYDQLIEHHPGSEIGARGAWAGAQMYESIAQFSDAARFYEAYGAHFPEAERAADALYNATLLRVTAGDHGRAVENGQRFLERFRRDDAATEVTFLIGRAHAAAGNWDQAAQVYRRFVRRTRDANRQIEAQTRLAAVLEEAGDTRGANRALTAAVRLARRRRSRLNDTGLYYAARARFMQAEDELRQYEEIQIAGPMEGLRQRLQQKSEFLRRAAEAFADVVEYQVAEYVTAALFQIGRSYELYAEGLRNAPVPEGLSEEEEMAYFDQLSSFVIPIEERALEAYMGGYETALELRIFNRWTASLREGLTRLNDVQFPPLREMGGDIADAAPIPMPAPLDGLRRGSAADEDEDGEDEEAEEADGGAALDTSIGGGDEAEEAEEGEEAEEAADERRQRRRRRRRRRR